MLEVASPVTPHIIASTNSRRVLRASLADLIRYLVLLRRFFNPRLAQSSYLIACSTSREGIVIDPHRNIEVFVAAAAADGVRITAVTETHIHADFLSGSAELAARSGARLYLSGEGRGSWSYADDFIRAAGPVLLQHGFAIRVGAVRLDILHTPGHTPEHITFLVTDTAVADEPMGAVTGDFLFVGDIGRPDLLERAIQVAGSAEGGARQLFRSLKRLSSFADYVQLWPGHSAGSACGKGISAVPHSTLGYERRHNWALQIGHEDEFVAGVLGGQPEAPAYFADMKRLNARGSRPWSEVGRPRQVGLDDLVGHLSHGTVVIDTRSASAYAANHIPGTVSLPLDRSFLTWTGSVVPIDASLLLIGDEHAVGEAVVDLGLIGMDHVIGYAGSDVIDAWQRRGRPLEPVRVVSAASAAERFRQGSVVVLDVRGASERAARHIPGSLHIPLPELPARVGEVPSTTPVVVHCQSGARSMIATSLLMTHGHANVENMEGGLAAWLEAGEPLAGANGTATDD